MADTKIAREAGFDSLGHGIYLKRPVAIGNKTQEDEDTRKHPTIIIIFGWMGARMPHLLKYTQGYGKLYPSATQLLVRCEPLAFFKPEWMKTSSFRPAIRALLSLGAISPNDAQPNANTTKHKILVQTFSNGGCLQLLSLGKQLSKYQCTTVSTSAVIFDSCPQAGAGTLSASIRAFTSIVRFAPLRVLVILSLYVLHFYATIRKRLFGIPFLWETAKARLNEPRVLPWLQRSSPRLYIYSLTDDLVSWQSVESHAKEAGKLFDDVRTERFENSGHVAHMKQDPERYWAAVEGLWNAAVA
jgi:hypothetical protein